MGTERESMLDTEEAESAGYRSVVARGVYEGELPDGVRVLDPGRWPALPVVLTAAFLSVLDFFIVNVSIPAMQRHFGPRR
jgi:hypothetical protein